MRRRMTLPCVILSWLGHCWIREKDRVYILVGDFLHELGVSDALVTLPTPISHRIFSLSKTTLITLDSDGVLLKAQVSIYRVASFSL